MSYKKLIIYEYDPLFNILNEIKENLNFELIRAQENDFQNIVSNLTSDFLVISKKNLEKINNQIILRELPIKMSKIIELVNVQFLKNKFNLQSNINIGSYSLNLNSRNIIKNDINLDLTERETSIIIYLNKSKMPIKIDELQKEVWGYSSELETHTVETHIYRLRKKMKEKFNDKNFISSLKNGYKIN
tara:strand:- start:1267 stop:1830 length:564 start_codon:yes stop_codon:yes gene_type:complete